MSVATARPHRPSCDAELVELVKNADPAAPLLVHGGRTKPALSSCHGTTAVDLRRLAGILAYEPSEFTITVRAGTPLTEIRDALRENGQGLPFDPPFVDRGSTAGGAVAAGLSGPARLCGGGVRDAVLAVRFVDGKARHGRAGAPVVKNAAGFDVPKLLVGSLGSLAILTEITFKVLPQPRAHQTGLFTFHRLQEAHSAALLLLGKPLRLDGLEILPRGDAWILAIRLGGEGSSLDSRLGRLTQIVTGLHNPEETEVLREDQIFWRQRRDVEWAPQGPGNLLVWIPTAATGVTALDSALLDSGASRAFIGGLSAAWASFVSESTPKPGEPHLGSHLDAALKELDLAGLVIRRGQSSEGSESHRRRILGQMNGAPFLRRVKEALDPLARFPDPS